MVIIMNIRKAGHRITTEARSMQFSNPTPDNALAVGKRGHMGHLVYGVEAI